jgi:hypothetical protein
MNRLVAALALVPLVACQPGQDVCTEAAEYYASCTGAPTPPVAASCGAEAAQLAEQMLDTTCDDLSGGDVGGKADTGAALAACTVLFAPLLVIHEQDEGDACCVPYNCKSGLTCHTDKIIPTCGPKRGEGGSCDTGWQCESELTCVFDECAPPLGEGAECDEGDCADGLTCVLGECAPPADAGAACEDRDCADGLVCSFGQCAPPSTEGAACEPDKCAPGLLCNVDGVCEQQLCDPNEFSPCGLDATCWNGACEPEHGDGEPCRSMFDCQFGLFCHRDLNVCHDPFADS